MTTGTTEIAIIRHPETAANVAGRFVGRGDSEITEFGREQIVALTAAMESWRPTAVFSSPLKRAFITAQAIMPCGVPVTVLDDLQEIDFGRAEGLTWDEIATLGMKIDYLRNGSADSADDFDGPGDGPVAPGGETWAAFEARVRRAAQVIEGADSRIAIVTHGGVARVLIAHWMGLPIESSWRFSISNATIATLSVIDGVGVLKGLQPARA
jgi:broad specificity phosphatase PhoE